MNNIAKRLIKASKNRDAAPVMDCSLYDIPFNVSTGCLMLDGLMSGRLVNGGMPVGRICELTGDTATAKSFVLMALLLEFIQRSTKHYIIFYESEMSLIKEQLKPLLTTSQRERFLIFPVQYHEQIIIQSAAVMLDIENIKNEAEKKGEKPPQFFQGLDSLGMLIPRKQLENALAGKETKVMNETQLIKAFFNQTKTPCMRLNIPFVYINHIYLNITGKNNAMKAEVDQKVTRGGQGVMFSPDIKIRLIKKSLREQQTPYKRLGIQVKAIATKNRFLKEYAEVVFDVMFDTGLDRYSGIWSFMLDNGYMTTTQHGNKGNSYHIDEIDWHMTKPELEKITRKEELYTEKFLTYADKCFQSHHAMGRFAEEKVKDTIKVKKTEGEPEEEKVPAIDELLK